MEMEVALPAPPVDFNFDSSCSSPYMSAPSSPQRFSNFFFSNPTSPSRVSPFCSEFNDSSASSVPFDWEEKPGTAKSIKGRQDHKNNNMMDDHDDGDFEFNFSRQLERTSLSADELFDGGKIRPLKPPPGCDSLFSSVSSPRSPRSRIARKKDFDPFQAAIEETRRKEVKPQEKQVPQQRGRETITRSSSSTRKGSRSFSPLRVSDIMFEPENSQNANIVSSTTTATSTTSSSYAASFLSAISFSKGYYKKWKLKDFLLFRSASEGRATGKDPLKYAVLSKREVVEDAKNASFRSTDSVGSSRRRASVSAHELHYTTNRAFSEERRRKTFLPYKQGLLGCLGFNPGMHEITRGLGSLTRG